MAEQDKRRRSEEGAGADPAAEAEGIYLASHPAPALEPAVPNTDQSEAIIEALDELGWGTSPAQLVAFVSRKGVEVTEQMVRRLQEENRR
jgi:hypothetical protein